MNIAGLAISVAALVHLASFVLMLYRVDPFYHFFYDFAWWTYIVFLAGVNHRLGRNSLLFDRPREFVWVFLLSTPVWLLFEAYNFRLNNWFYVGVPLETHIRWPGYFVAFGTVLPGLFETATFLENTGLFRRLRGRSLKVSRALHVRFIVIGILMMAAPLIRPDFFFPLVWLGLNFLLDPVVYRWGDRTLSYSGQAEGGDYSRAALLLVAGMICGLLWEFWNFWAGSKWVYTVPHLDFLNIFEMPLLGFFGFPPFALECYLIYQAFVMFRRRFLQGGVGIPVLTAVLFLVYCLCVFRGIDEKTVAVYRFVG